MPYGYGPAMQLFTKAPFSLLQSRELKSVVYVEDSDLQGNNFDLCLHNVKDTTQILREIRFTIHLDKSNLISSQKITFLGFTISPKI